MAMKQLEYRIPVILNLFQEPLLQGIGIGEDMPGKFIVRIPSAKNKSLYRILTNDSIHMSTVENLLQVIANQVRP